MTGRPIQYVWPLVRELGIGEYVVAANGTTVGEVMSGAVLYQASLAGRVVLAAVNSARAAVDDLRLAITTSLGFRVEPGFDVIAPLSKADTVVVEDASPHPDDTVHNAVLFVLGPDATTLLQRVVTAVPPGVHVSPWVSLERRADRPWRAQGQRSSAPVASAWASSSEMSSPSVTASTITSSCCGRVAGWPWATPVRRRSRSRTRSRRAATTTGWPSSWSACSAGELATLVRRLEPELRLPGTPEPTPS